jgi:tetratricopeptide (TPR) repeat protein
VGKTALALKLAERLKGRYPDAQFYLDLRGAGPKPLPVADALAHVIHAYHPTSKLPESESELRGLYLSVLHNRRALLLMDNAKDEWQVEPLIPPAGCALLVTSRNHFMLPGLFAKSLDSLPLADACALLLTIAPRIGELAGEIAKLCGHLPLALRLAGSALAKYSNLKPADYVWRLTDARERLKLIEASLSLSYELLGNELQERWRALAVFPETFDEAAAAAVWELEADAAQERLSELFSFSLVEWNETAARYGLHDLARVFTDTRLSEDERRANQQRHAEHYQKVIEIADNLFLLGGEALTLGLAFFDLEWANAQAGQAWANRNASDFSRALELCDDYPARCYNILPLRQHPRQRTSWLETALSATRKLGRKQTEGWHLGNLGTAYADLGETRRAIELFEQRLAIAREISDRRGEGNALGNLGLANAVLGETRRAIEFYEQALVIDREIGDRRGEGADLGNLGNANAALGETQRAIEFYEQHLAITREIGDRRGEGNALWNTALALDKLGDRAQAIACAEAAFKIYEQIEDPGATKVREQLKAWHGEGAAKNERQDLVG